MQENNNNFEEQLQQRIQQRIQPLIQQLQQLQQLIQQQQIPLLKNNTPERQEAVR